MFADEFGLYDGMTPRSAISTSSGLTVAIYLTKLPTHVGRENQEIHLLKLEKPPADIYEVYHGRA